MKCKVLRYHGRSTNVVEGMTGTPRNDCYLGFECRLSDERRYSTIMPISRPAIPALTTSPPNLQLSDA